VAAAGFDALLVEVTHHLVRGRDTATAELDALLGRPAGTSEDGTFAWYDLRPLRTGLATADGSAAVRRAGRLVERPIGVDYDGVTELTMHGRVMERGGAVRLRRLDGDTAPVSVTLQVSARPGTRVTVGGRDVPITGRDPVTVERTLDLDHAVSSVEVRADGPVAVSNVTVIDRGALDDPVIGPATGAPLPITCM
jgi:hypothetical protein